MKRVALKLVLFLLLGAILNVGIAWAFATLVNPLPDARTKVDGQRGLQGNWSRFDTPGSSVVCVFGAFPARPLPAWVLTAASSMQPRHDLIAEARGWPTRSIYQTRDAFFETINGIRVSAAPFETWFGAHYPRALPLRPIWPGFAINTIFYAAILWLPFTALGAFRRRRRIKRGMCPVCGYDLRGGGAAVGSKVCPECGKPDMG